MDIAWRVLPALIEASGITLKLFGITLLFSLPLGLLVGLGSTLSFKPLKAIIGGYIWIIRGTPLLLQMFFIFYGLPLFSEIRFERLDAAILAFVINYTAYYAEIFRGGIEAIGNGQYEGAKVLGLTKFQTIRKIIIPQVLKIVLPSVGNEVITLVKDTSLVYAVGLSDIMRTGQIALQREVSIIPLIVVALIYLVLTGIVTIILKFIERKYSYYK